MLRRLLTSFAVTVSFTSIKVMLPSDTGAGAGVSSTTGRFSGVAAGVGVAVGSGVAGSGVAVGAAVGSGVAVVSGSVTVSIDLVSSVTITAGSVSPPPSLLL